MVKRLLLLTVLVFTVFSAASAKKTYVFTEVSSLNLCGKIMPTPNPYHRVDSVLFPSKEREVNRLLCSAGGLYVFFKTNSSTISVKSKWGFVDWAPTTMGVSSHGFDLYVKSGSDWLWAGSISPKPQNMESNAVLVSDMSDSYKECMLFLPTLSELVSCQIGIEEGCEIESIPSPFRHKILFYGSSFTHGVGTSRSGMSYPAQFMRETGFGIIPLGVSGRCTMQPYFANLLKDVDADAFVFDSFSNPSPETMRRNFKQFIDAMVQNHPGKPLIFQKSIYRERRNFSNTVDSLEQARVETAEMLMREIMGKPEYKDVYFIQTNATSDNHETTVDGVHPSDWGYRLWCESIERPIVEILARYGIQ